MATAWFALVVLALAAYAVLDGFDLGVGIVHLFVARTEGERARVMRSIAPFWDGNEVWLIAAAGALLLAFPAFYAAALSGFYLPLMVALWLLAGRALAVELRHQVSHPVWRSFWDRVFAASSGLLVLGYGAALGRLARGVPIDEHGRFFLPLWGGGDRPGLLDPYTLSVGVTALAALSTHGALWVAWRLEGEARERARRFAARSAVATAVVGTLVAAWTLLAEGRIASRLLERPWAWAAVALAGAGLGGVLGLLRRGSGAPAFLASCAFLLGALATVALVLFPDLVVATTDPARSLTVFGAAADPTALSTGLWWCVPGVLLVAGYQAWVYRRFRGRVAHDEEGY